MLVCLKFYSLFQSLRHPLQHKTVSYSHLFYSKQWIQCISKADKSNIVCSEKISYFFTSDEFDLYFFTVANTCEITDIFNTFDEIKKK